MSTSSTPSTAPSAHEATAQEVLDFWLGDGLLNDWPSTDHHTLWFGGQATHDHQIAQRFGGLVAEALAGGLTDWEDALHSRLALVILLDQFTRNVHRGQARAFAGDARAQHLVRATLARQQDRLLPRVGRVFLYMPLMHAEDLALQNECVERFSYLVDTATVELRDTLASNLRFARQHRDIIATFGRFPYRNAVLGRPSTPAEIEFLKDGPRFGQ
ncbi:MAG: DUF924 domain-containing protein [Hydrogenophaga sp.]|jgi:uncharacterized protein (DUF924 family)|nr:DUF924 domain-containing protein [Hydrogenophaga sp.]